MTGPNVPAVELPGRLIVDPNLAVAMQRPPQIAQGPDLANPASLGAILVAAGVDPVVAAKLIEQVQVINANATMQAIQLVALTMHEARVNRDRYLTESLRAIPRVDMWNAKETLARVMDDPTLPITRDPTPSALPPNLRPNR